ncbi:class I SAM-dependent methyltransferase [Gordonia sp. DT219]|uniref:class I SAM-dependent methyltransferase n=1 Tax=Gordonia sp. DT219 TaxID=3416658 RepID=UPI003CE73B8F
MDTNTTTDAAARWNSVADGWARWGPAVERGEADLTALIRAGLGPMNGRTIIELGSGSGELAAQLAVDVGPDGRVLATDIAPGMTEIQTALLAGVSNVSVLGGVDAADLHFDDGTADAVVFRMGLMMTARPDDALQSIRRVLRPGGRFVTTVWGPAIENPWLTSVGMAAMSQGLVSGGPPVAPGEPFSLPDPDDLRRRFGVAGFGDVSVTTHRGTRHYPDAHTHVDMALALAPPLAAAARTISAEQSAALRGTVIALTAGCRNTDGSYDIPMCAHLASGVAPG